MNRQTPELALGRVEPLFPITRTTATSPTTLQLIRPKHLSNEEDLEILALHAFGLSYNCENSAIRKNDTNTKVKDLEKFQGLSHRGDGENSDKLNFMVSLKGSL
jgi:hypothetical protein